MFEDALIFTMKYEVGPHFKLDEETRQGLIKTKAQQRKCGYVNDPADKGGETKFGIAQKKNPDVDVKSLTWEQAKAIYEARYWQPAKCELLAPKAAFAHFDAAVNHGPTTAIVLLQRAANTLADGVIGQLTMQAINKVPEDELVAKMLIKRRERFQAIVRNDPTQAKFLNGWLNRCDDLEKSL